MERKNATEMAAERKIRHPYAFLGYMISTVNSRNSEPGPQESEQNTPSFATLFRGSFFSVGLRVVEILMREMFVTALLLPFL